MCWASSGLPSCFVNVLPELACSPVQLIEGAHVAYPGSAHHDGGRCGVEAFGAQVAACAAPPALSFACLPNVASSADIPGDSMKP
jgi:hypothetical protein